MDKEHFIARWSMSINETPFLLSVLYDLNLLPEQDLSIRDLTIAAAICMAYEEGWHDGFDTIDKGKQCASL